VGSFVCHPPVSVDLFVYNQAKTQEISPKKGGPKLKKMDPDKPRKKFVMIDVDAGL
jgi:hypothetical protein